MRAAVEAVKQQQPARAVVAVPVASAATCEELRREADEVVCLLTPEPFYAVGLWNQDLSQTTDEEVRIHRGKAFEKTSRCRWWSCPASAGIRSSAA